MLSGRYHPTLNPLASRRAQEEWQTESLARGLQFWPWKGVLSSV